MHKTHAKRRRDIKTKLMAAICMLLVSSIMMVSTTYAWFTLSTAPEVTGINTAVGANGNLEMALQPSVGHDAIAESTSGDGTGSLDTRNVTWGNLVDLSYAVGNQNYYGLDKITLNPSKLNAENGVLGAALLQTPSYGADGRVDGLVKNTVTSLFDTAVGNFPQTAGYGVRAIGNASGMTDRQLDYRNYKSDANTAISQATTLARNSLSNNGASLANIAIKHFLNTDATHTQTEIGYLRAIVDNLLGDGTTTNPGVIGNIENGYRYLIVAYGASATGAAKMNDETYMAFKSAVLGAATLDAAVSELTSRGVELPEGVADPIAKLATTKATVTTAKNELNALTGDAVAWSDLMVPMQKLVNISKLTLLDFPVSEAKEHIADIAANLNNLVLTMPSGGGVYADVADHCGDYFATIDLQVDIGEVMGGGSSGLATVKATMQTDSDVSLGYLNALAIVAADAGSPASAGGQVMPISDFYGYIVDLAFRTNASASNLLLQTTPEGRIYDAANSAEETMGHGSTMTFTSGSVDYTLDQMADLMDAIRVVFFTTNDNTILATAKLDMTEGNYTVSGGDTITANLYLYTTSAGGTTYNTATAEQIAAAKAGTEGAAALYTRAADSDTYTKVDDASTIVDDNSVTYYVEVNTLAGETMITNQADAVITALTQNTATPVSVLVYLDGENVTNADVAIGGYSMTGTLNLQFSSSANLVPMNYTPLMNQGNTQNNGTSNNPAETTTPATTESQAAGG